MRYLVLRKPSADVNPLVEMISAGGGSHDFEFPLEREVIDVSDKDAADIATDPLVADIVASIPFTLIRPLAVDGPSEGAASNSAWGIDAVGALKSPQDGSGVTVAVLDTGIERRHDAFKGIEFHDDDLMDFSEVCEGKPGSAADNNGHGTHCAGTIVGRDVGGTRIGVARGVSRVLIGKVLDANGRGPTEAILNGIEWALKRKADVISMSLGMDFPGYVKVLTEKHGFPVNIATSRALEGYLGNVRLFDRLSQLIAARVATGRGALIVAASGNESQRKVNPQYTVAVGPPAVADGFIAVGALKQTGDKQQPLAVADFSNTGCAVSAPGQGILSAGLDNGLKCLKKLDGTSMATPHVAGVAVLWTQRLFPDPVERPAGWANDVKRRIESTVRPVAGAMRRDVGLGLVASPE